MGDLAHVLGHLRHAILSAAMTDLHDIVTRLREYTRHNLPVLASDLKEAADEIANLRSLLATEPASLVSFARRVSEQAGHSFDENESCSVVYAAVGEVRRERDALHGRLCDIADATSYRGVPLAGPGLVEHVRKVVRDRDALLPQDLLVDEPPSPAVAAEGHRPGFIIPPAPSWDEVDRRIAELESRVRLTERRLRSSVLLSRIADALESKR